MTNHHTHQLGQDRRIVSGPRESHGWRRLLAAALALTAVAAAGAAGWMLLTSGDSRAAGGQWLAGPVPAKTWSADHPDPSGALDCEGKYRQDMSPGTLFIPSLCVDAPLGTTGDKSNDQGGGHGSDQTGPVVDVPYPASKVAAYDKTAPLRARKGTTVITGHVTWGTTKGALYPLHLIEPGAVIATRDQSGRRQLWVADSLRVYDKSRGLPARLFRTDGPRRLALITCAGEVTMTKHGRSYAANLVVTAYRLITRTRTLPRPASSDGAVR